MPRVGADDIFVSYMIAQSNSDVNSKNSNFPKKSVRDGDDMSTRYILATTLMETTVNEAELKSMREYKDAIKDLKKLCTFIYLQGSQTKKTKTSISFCLLGDTCRGWGLTISLFLTA